MTRFAQEGYRVLYVDTLGLRSPKLRDLPRIASRLRNRLQAKQSSLRQPEAGVHVVSPLILPFLNSRLARSLNIRRLVPQLQRQLKQIGSDDLIIWVYLPTWSVLQCVERIPHSMLVYESIDALESNPAGLSLGYAEAEAEILRRSDLVITTSESLHREKAAGNRNAHWVPSGVAEEFFAPVEPVEEMREIGSPKIGFFGTIDHRLDLELVRQVARTHRDWSVILIGAARCDIGELVAEENVHFLGPQPHGALPGYLRGLDVLWLPYVVDDFTRHVYPAKIFECLALGKPVVSTVLPSLEGFGEVVRLVEGREAHEEGLREALAEEDEDLMEQRVALARDNSWESRFREIQGFLEQVRT